MNGLGLSRRMLLYVVTIAVTCVVGVVLAEEVNLGFGVGLAAAMGAMAGRLGVVAVRSIRCLS